MTPVSELCIQIRTKHLKELPAMFESLGNFLRLRRQERNLSQERLAEMASISRGQLALMEKGENVSLQFLVRVANALELSELPVAGLRLREAPPELEAIIWAADAVATIRRLLAQVAGQAAAKDERLGAAEKVLGALIDRALSPAGSTRAITDGAQRMRTRPAADHDRIAAGLRELASTKKPRAKRPATAVRTESGTGAARRRTR
jgi:transcriptional regulator with XRE-family HTH domain